MPIIIKDYTWNQNENIITIKIPLHGIHQSKVDVFYCKLFLKASFEQFYIEFFLLKEINPPQSSCTITSTKIIFELTKCEPLQWETLEKSVPKITKMSLKHHYIEEELERIRAAEDEKSNNRAELKRVAVREQIEIDSIQRKNIETIKETEKQQVLTQLELTSNNKSLRKKTKTKLGPKINLFKLLEESDNIKPPTNIPSLRASSTLEVEFTPREFPTPIRESKIEEENEWLRKQAEARRSAGFISEDLRPEEHNPQFLLAKGDEFLKNGNFLGAISAYSFGIKLNDKFADLYVARSGAHFAIGNFNKTAQDCSRALELLTPEVELNKAERALCIGRRGVALVKLGMKRQGIDELYASLRMKHNDEFEKAVDEAEDLSD